MKHSHRLLIVLAVLVGALVLFLWPRSTAATPWPDYLNRLR
ncbi:hypothetical protein [Massilia sp. DWR3-1-1]